MTHRVWCLLLCLLVAASASYDFERIHAAQNCGARRDGRLEYFFLPTRSAWYSRHDRPAWGDLNGHYCHWFARICRATWNYTGLNATWSALSMRWCGVCGVTKCSVRTGPWVRRACRAWTDDEQEIDAFIDSCVGTFETRKWSWNPTGVNLWFLGHLLGSLSLFRRLSMECDKKEQVRHTSTQL